MAEGLNTELVAKAEKALLGLNEALNKVDATYKKYLSTTEKTEKQIKESAKDFNNLKKAQDNLNTSYQDLNRAKSQQQKISRQLEREQQKSIQAAERAAIKERQLIKDINNEGRSIDELRAKKKALITLRDRLNRTTDEGSAKFRRYSNEINRTHKEIVRATGVGGQLTQALKGQIKTLATMAASYIGVMAAIRGVSNAIRTFVSFDKNISKVAAISGATGVELGKLRKLAQDLGESTEKTASQVAELEIELAKLGFTSEQIIDATDAILDLSTAADSDLAQAAKVAASTVRGFGKEAKDTRQVTDVMALSFSRSALDLSKFETAMAIVAPVAKNANVSIERTTALLSQLANRGVDASTSGTSLRNIFLELAKKGLTWNEAMNRINNSTNKNATALELFGKRGATAALILAQNTEETEVLTQMYEKAEGATKRMADIMRDNLAGDTIKAQSALQGLSINLVEKLNPFLRRTTQGFTEFIGKLNEIVKIDPAETIKQEQNAVLGLVSQLTDVNSSESDRYEILNKLKEINKDIVKGLNFENINIETLRKNLNLYNSSVAQRIVLENLNIEEQKKASELADIQIQRANAIIRLNQNLIKQDSEVSTSKLSLSEKVDLINNKTKEELKTLEESFSSQERNLQIQTFRTEQAAKLRSNIATLEIGLSLINELTNKENELTDDGNKLKERQIQILKILGVGIEDLGNKSKKSQEYIGSSIEGLNEGLDELENKEDITNEIDSIANSIDNLLEEGIERDIENEYETNINATEDFLNEKYELEKKALEDKKKLTEAEIELEELKKQALYEGLGFLASIFGKKTALGKAFFIAQKAQAVAEILVNLQKEKQQISAIYAANPILAAILRAGASIRAAIAVGQVVSTVIQGFKTGTKGKYSTPDTFITSEDSRPEIVQTKSGKSILTTKPTIFKNMAGSRVFSNPELSQLVNNSISINYDTKQIELLRNDINNGTKKTIQAIKRQPIMLFDNNNRLSGIEQNKYRRNYR